MIRCEHVDEETGKAYGWHHHDGPHACDAANHDGQCPWRAGVSGAGIEPASDMTATVNQIVITMHHSAADEQRKRPQG